MESYRKNIDALLDRQIEKGIRKYGTTLEHNTSLSDIERIEYLQEELVDALMYCEHIKAYMREHSIKTEA